MNQTEVTLKALEKEEKGEIDLSRAHQQEDLDNKKEKRALRSHYAKRTFILTCVWLGVVLIIVFLQGWAPWRFHLQASEIITLLSTTTANILGVLLIIIKYLYKD